MSDGPGRAEPSLVVDVVELRRHTGTRRPVRRRARLDGMTAGEFHVVGDELELDLVVEAITEGVMVSGTVAGRWTGPCRRCLEPIDAPLEVEVREIYERHPTEGETWLLDDERIDLAPMVREAAVLALPLAPLCRGDCAGPEPDRFPTTVAPDAVDEGDPGGERRDPRWAALDVLREEAGPAQ
jgi:uncharacterized protein